MENKIALLIIYNHRYDKNIAILDELYSGKFTHVFHVMPFYDGNKENVLTVYDSSFYFESYVAQAYQRIKNMGFTHYYFIADDMILNPQINERNLFDFTRIPQDCCWINDFRDYTTHPYGVPICINAKKKGIEVNAVLPSMEEVCANFDYHSLSYFPNKWYAVKDFFYSFFRKRLSFCLSDIYILRHGYGRYCYPGVWGYSDTLLIPSEMMDKFSLYCGALAGLNVFVEHAIPLALLMTTNRIKTQKDIKLKTVTQLYGLGKNGQKEFFNKYKFSLEKLMSEFPEDWFFVHPIKLSKWK